jgi:hypothetical protein
LKWQSSLHLQTKKRVFLGEVNNIAFNNFYYKSNFTEISASSISRASLPEIDFSFLIFEARYISSRAEDGRYFFVVGLFFVQP